MSAPLIGFRADASVQIGTGHVMRCLALAAQLQRKGVEVVFLSRDLPASLQSSLEKQKVKLLPLPASKEARHGGFAHSHWLATSQAEDARLTLAALKENGLKPDGLVVDHYGIGREWESLVRSEIDRILVIDDLADRAHDCDWLLDQTFNPLAASEYAPLVPPGCHLLLGPRFALLRPEFAELRKQAKPKPADGRQRMIVFFGGGDPTGETLKALRAVETLGRKNLTTTVIASPTNPHQAEIKKRAGQIPGVTFESQVPDMASLMNEADIFLGAGGVTTWERCCLGVPTLTVAIAQNQVKGARLLAEAGGAIFLGEKDAVNAEKISAAVASLLDQPQVRESLSVTGRKLVDGQGAERVANALLEAPIELRRATALDCKPIFEWRNHPDTRKYFFDPAPLVFANHEKWFAATLGKPDERPLLVGHADGQPVGVLRYDRQGTEFVVSVYLVPQMQGKGLGPRLLMAGNKWLSHHMPGATRVVAEVLPENTASVKAFLRAGFVAENQNFVFKFAGAQK